MNKEQINIAIAEACGFKVDPSFNEPWNIWTPDGKLTRKENIPNYHEDLNAMYEAGKILDDRQKQIYSDILSDIAMEYKTNSLEQYSEYLKLYFEVKLEDVFLMVNATAAQRAEAFLRTLNLWKDSEK